MRDGYFVVDADCHLIEPDGALNEYLEPSFRQFAPRLLPIMSGEDDRWLIEGKLFPKPYGKGRGYDWGLLWPWREHEARSYLADFDLEGIDVGVMFPSMGLFLAGIESPDVAAALYRAYNSWVADLAKATDPTRFRPVGILPLQNVPAAVKEVERVASDLGLIGVTVATQCQGKNLNHPEFEPLLAAIQDAGLPLMIHTAAGASPPPAGSDRFNNFFFTHQVTHPFEQMIAFAAVVAGGVLERFPRLRLGFCEAGAGWVPYWLERLDEHYETRASLVPELRAKPSEYLKDGRVYVTCEPEEHGLPHALETIGDGSCVFSSDYPHFDSKFPDAVSAVVKRPDLTQEQKKKVLSDNAARLFRLPPTR